MPATPELCSPTRGNASVSSSSDSREGLWARWPRPQRRNDDGVPGALDDGDDLGLLRRRHLELRQRQPQVVHEGVPLVCGDGEVALRIAREPSGVLLGPARGLADHLGDEELEACRGDPMVRLVHGRILVQPGIGHDPVDEVVDHRGDVVDAADAVVQRRSRVGCIGPSNSTACEVMLGCRNRRRLCAGRLPTQPSLATAQDRVNPSPCVDRHGGAAGPAMPEGETFTCDGSAGIARRQVASEAGSGRTTSAHRQIR